MGQAPIPAIINAIAAAEAIGPEELTTPLHAYIAPGAIKRLAAHQTATWELSFTYQEHQVAVTSDGEVIVDDAHKETWK